MPPCRGLVALALSALACTRVVPAPVAPPPAPPPAFRVPTGCEADLSGPWRLAGRDDWAYRGIDDGGTLLLEVHPPSTVDAGFVPRRFRALPDAGSPDAGPPDAVDAGPPEPDAGPLRLVLVRALDGFRGGVEVPAPGPDGTPCRLRFSAEVTACDGGLWLRSQAALRLADGCAPDADDATSWATQHLVRPDAG